jgi:hypothetical protein
MTSEPNWTELAPEHQRVMLTAYPTMEAVYIASEGVTSKEELLKILHNAIRTAEYIKDGQGPAYRRNDAAKTNRDNTNDTE